MNYVEILAPVGNFECLEAAIEAGCDAVYLGGYQFGARSFAGNFSNSELTDAVIYAHTYNVKVYVTVNTLVYEHEVDTFLNYVDFLVSIHVDALIIQDIGMLDLVHQVYPDLELHASTQMHIHNLDGVRAAQKLGCHRVVLARETEIEEIASIRSKTDMELEIFVHGALCVSYSGQCLMSSLIGGRSGNRGTCAGSCRQKYQLVKFEKQKEIAITDMEYLLSMKDLNTLSHLKELLEVGVDSLKIEGRMKRPSYVYAVVSLYKKAVMEFEKTGDIQLDLGELKRLQKIFDRGSTKGFLFHEKNQNITNSFRPNHLGIEIGTVTAYHNNLATVKLIEPVSIHDGLRILGREDVGTVLNVFRKKNQIIKRAYKNDEITFLVPAPVLAGSKVVKTTDYLEQEEIAKEIEKHLRKVSIIGILNSKIGEPLSLTLKEGNVSVTIESDYIVEKASHMPTTIENQKQQLSRLGSTVYEFSELQINSDLESFVPAKILNELRRNAISKLTDKRLFRPLLRKEQYKRNSSIIKEPNNFSLKINNLQLLDNVEEKFLSLCYIPFETKKIGIPYFMNVMSSYPKLKETVLIGELGGTHLSSFITDVSMNVTNSYTVMLLHSLGAKRVALSYEMDDLQIKELIEGYRKRYHSDPNLELVVYGREEMMISKFNLAKKYQVKEPCFLKDRFGNLYPVMINHDFMVLYHDKIRKLSDFKKYFNMGISVLRLQALYEEELDEIMSLIKV